MICVLMALSLPSGRKVASSALISGKAGDKRNNDKISMKAISNNLIFFICYSSLEAFFNDSNATNKLPINKINFQHFEKMNLINDQAIWIMLPNNENTFLIVSHTKLIVSPH